jgi:spore maturation protein CgeB
MPQNQQGGTLPGTSRPAAGSRIFVIGSQSFADSMEWHVIDALPRIGAEFEFFAARAGFAGTRNLAQKIAGKIINLALREPERVFERRLLRAVQRFAPQLILVILGNQISPKTIARLRSHTSAPIVCWCQDQMTTLGRQFLLGAGYDAVFVKDRYMQDLFSRMIGSTKFYYLAEACNPRVHRSLPVSEQDHARYGCDVMIAGSLYYYRQEILRQLDEFDVKVWGYRPDWLLYRLRWPHMGREILLDDKARAARAARIALNSLHFAEVDGLNCRAFELAGCGAFQICTARPVLSEHFEIGAEIETFSSSTELVEKIRHYLRNPDEAAGIGARGQLRAHREHTYEIRLSQIIRIALG